MKRYVDGFVLPIKNDRISGYQEIAEAASKIWLEHGALEYWECVGDDLNSECTRTFSEMADAAEDEVVIFAWAVFESREARDVANEKILADPRMAELMEAIDTTIDCQRMAHGGFQEIVHAG